MKSMINPMKTENENVSEGNDRAIKNDNPKAGKKSGLGRMLIFSLCMISLALLVYTAGTLFLARDNHDILPKSATEDSDVYFQDCKLLEKDCKDTSCNMYIWCGDGDHKVCRIYDCADTYGVFTTDLQDKIKTERKAKPDIEALQAQKDNCSGSIRRLEEKCVDEKMQVKVKLETKGKCEINTFALIYKDAGAQPNQFSAVGENTYLITAYGCGTVEQIIPGTKEGIALDFLTEA